MLIEEQGRVASVDMLGTGWLAEQGNDQCREHKKIRDGITIHLSYDSHFRAGRKHTTMPTWILYTIEGLQGQTPS